jgi:hypothetical protein
MIVADGSPAPQILERNIFGQRLNKKAGYRSRIGALMLLAAKVKCAAPSHFVKVITGYDLMQAVLFRLAGFGGDIGSNHDTQLDEISNEP